MSDTANADCPGRPRSEITDPCPLNDQQQIVDELVKGRWVAYAHEWLPSGTVLEHWTTQVSALCQRKRLTVELATHAAAALTIVMNTAAMPTLAQIEATAAAVQEHRSHNSARATAAI